MQKQQPNAISKRQKNDVDKIIIHSLFSDYELPEMSIGEKIIDLLGCILVSYFSFVILCNT